MSEPPDTNDPTTLRVISASDSTNRSDCSESLSVGIGHTSESAGTESVLDEDNLDSGDLPADLLPADLPADDETPVVGKRIALVGRFGSMSHREAANVLLSFRATVVDLPRRRSGSANPNPDAPAEPESTIDWAIDWIVIGAEQPPLSQSELLPPAVIDAAARGEMEIIHETELWQRLGLLDAEQSVSSLYTPAMLADLLGVSVRVIRRWHRLGLITPVSTLHKLPYFDYAEVATAKRLAGWIAAGASPRAIERRLAEFVHVLPNIRRPLAQLSVLVEGKHILLRQGDGLVEPGGQMRFDFEALDPAAQHTREIVAFEPPDQPPMLRTTGVTEDDAILVAAYAAEDEDDLETAIDLYHLILSRDGARSDICFQLGELLYRMNFLVAARERYYAAIELEPEFVEARASLGAVLAELGKNELAIAALRGALTLYDDYADVHYTLAKTLDKVGDDNEALLHWKRIIELAPESPWAVEAKERLGDGE